MTVFLIAAAGFACGFAGYHLADLLARQQLEWHLEKLMDPRLPGILAKRFTDDRLRFLCKSIFEIKDALKIGAEPQKEENGGGDKPAS